MFHVYILHTLGADKILEFSERQQADNWIKVQHDPKLFYIVDWSL